MNVLISNKRNREFQSLNIDVIKSLNGEFTVDEIITTFKNFFYQRMILDITAIKDYKRIENLQKLSISLDMDKIILVLDGSLDSSSQNYLSNLVSIGIYNFTPTVAGISYLYSNPNSYRDVAQYHQFQTQETGNNISTGNYTTSMSTNNALRKCKVIGFKNVTNQSGATTFTYMVKNQLKEICDVIAIEVDKADFTFFKDQDLITSTSSTINGIINKHQNKDVILVDVNKSKEAADACDDIIYLLEPSMLKLNKYMAIRGGAIQSLREKKVVLNQSLLTPKDVLDFEYESGLKIFFNMPPLDERERSIFILNKFLSRLGFDTMKEEKSDNKLFSFL